MNNCFWKFRNLADGQKAELLLYGNISESSWWGDEVTPKQFADDLAALGDVQEITVYINSGGGDVFAAQAIGNQLERSSATVTVHIDGLCASAATIIACHADKVIAAADSCYMIHPASMGVCDYLTAEDMRDCLKALDTIRENIVALYAKKTGKSTDQCGKWMDETNWWTAAQAKENGFIDEVDDEIFFFMQILGDTKITMPVVLDWEYISDTARTANVDARTLTDMQKHFCETMLDFGYQPMVYFNWTLADKKMYLNELEDYPFWLALYQDRMTYPFRVEMWQYTCTGRVPGIEGDVDINVFMPDARKLWITQ